MGDWQTDSRKLTPYIPRTILEWYQTSSGDEVHVITKHNGCVVCIDASGFTALTRQLSAMGKEGPEVLTGVLNLFFEAVSDVIFQYGGDVLKFAGDALWAYFPEYPDLAVFFGDILEAVESVNSNPSLKHKTELSVHIGAESGEFFLASLGDRGIRLEAEPLGNLLGTVYRACDVAGDNEFAIGPALAHQCAGMLELQPADSGFRLVTHRRSEGKRRADADDSYRVGPIGNRKVLRSYIPQDVLSRIETSAPSMSVQGEHRQVVVLFASFENNIGRKTDDPIIAVQVLNEKLLKGFEAIRDSHGSIARIDPFKRGHKLLVLFGAPAKREDDEINALLSARKLLELNDSSFRIRIGLAIGPLFCGDVGAERRREYTVMGDGINLAARLMAKAQWGEMIISPELKPRLPHEVMTEPVTLSLKGIGDGIQCHRFVDVSEASAGCDKSVTIVGQEKELEALEHAWHQTRQGQQASVIISGSAGVGKTTLVQNFLARKEDVEPIILACKNTRLFGSGWLTRKLFQELVQTHPVASSQGFEDFILGRVEQRWHPLLEDIVQTGAEDNEWTRGLTPELRIEKTRELLADLIRVLVTSPRPIVMDDFDMSDEIFKGWMLSMTNDLADVPLMLIMVTRDSEALRLPDDTGGSRAVVRVTGPTDKQWWGYFSANFAGARREKELLERILAASDRNPHFIMRFLGQCMAEQKLVKNEVTGKWELRADQLQISVPDGLANLHLSVFDALPEIERTIMKAASVAIGDFSAKLLSQGLPDIGLATIQTHLESLTKSGLLERSPTDNRFSIAHTSMRESIYQCISESQLRRLHHRFAEIIEAKNSDKHAALLAHHFYRAGVADKGFRYSLDAARKSFDRYALTESAEFFGQCIRILNERDARVIDAAEQISFYENYASLLFFEGRYKEMHPWLRKWRKLGRSSGLIKESIMAVVETARVLWSQTRYSRSRRVLKYVLSYAEDNDADDVRVRALMILCQLERRSGEFTRAQEVGSQAVELATRLNDSNLVADAYTKLGLSYWGGGKLDEAATAFQKAIESGDVDKRDLAVSYNNLAIIEQDRGHFLESEKLLIQALEIARNIGDKRNEAYCSGNLANLSREFGKITRAEELFLQANLIFERLGDRHAHFYTVGNLGDIDLMRGEISSAARRFNAVMEFARKVEDKELIAECNVRYGELAFFTGDIEKAKAMYETAIDIAGEIGSAEYLTRACIGLARLLIGQRNHDQALEVIARISHMARENNAILAENEAAFLTGEHHRISGEPDKAAASYRQTLDYARSQDLFELRLKSAVRLHETDPLARDDTTRILSELRLYFVEHNSLPAWDQLVNSAYFSYFAETLKEIAGVGQLCSHPTVLE